MKKQKGFTILELMVVVAIIAIIFTIAVPSYITTVRNSNMRNALQEWQSSFYLAQAEAMRTRKEVTLCGSSNQSSCDGTGFESGWIVLSGSNVVKAYPSIRGDNITMSLNGSSPNSITIKPNGNISGFVGATLKVEYKKDSETSNRTLVISREGRMRLGEVSQTDTSDNNRW